MRLINLRWLIPERAGGPYYNIYNSVVVWSKIPPEFRPSFLECLKHPLDFLSDVIRWYRAPLWNWIENHKPERILEIGLGSGVNAKKMTDLAGDCTYFCFDDLSKAAMVSYKELREMPNTKFYIGDTIETLPKFVNFLPKMDLIFIDGAHDYIHVKNDWKHCKKLMHSSTACFFHDYDRFDVRRVVDSIDKEFRIDILTPPYPPCFALVRRK